MSNISVKYNNNVIFPTPVVSENYKFIDFPGNRWGNINEITLQGMMSGIVGTGDVFNILNIFTGQFGTLQVIETPSNNIIYNWNNVIIEDISFSNSHYYPNTVVPYTIKAHVYNVPSGVTNPSNEYAFTQNNDETVNVTHKISAQGIKNSVSAFNNAVSFVQNFTGKQPFANCASYFISSGTGILLSLQEKIDRANATYSVIETYKCNTGSTTPYIKLSDISISDDLNSEYLTLDYNVKFQSSPVYNNLVNMENSLIGYNPLSEISSLGINTGFFVLYTSSVVRDSGACTIDLKNSYISGYSTQEFSGFLDYDVSLTKDLLMPKETWKIEGVFQCYGPIAYKQSRLSAFKTANQSNWQNYLVNLITNSPIYSGFHTTGNLLSNNPVVDIQENTGLATFKISLSIDDGYEPTGIADPKYSIEVEPSHWAYELIPAANIEGHYIVQDLQMQTRSKMNFTLNGQSQYPSQFLNNFSGFLSNFQTIYVNTGFLIGADYNTGLFDLSCSNRWIGNDNFGSGILNTKVAGTTTFNFNRLPNFYFGF